MPLKKRLSNLLKKTKRFSLPVRKAKKAKLVKGKRANGLAAQLKRRRGK